MSDIKDIGLKIEAITEALRVINIVNHTDLHLDQKHIEMLKVLRVDLSDHLDALAALAAINVRLHAGLKVEDEDIQFWNDQDIEEATSPSCNVSEV